MNLKEKLHNQGNYLFKYRGQLPVIMMLIVSPIIVHTSLYNQLSNELRLVIQNTAILIGFIGLFFRYYTIGSTPYETSGKNRNQQIAKHLNTTGAYSIVRNPLYLANYIIWLSIGIYSLSYTFLIILTLCFILHYERIILSEEDFLLKKFKNRYSDFCKDTPIFFPKIRNYQTTKSFFSLKKVVTQEYSSTASTIIAFIYIDFLIQYSMIKLGNKKIIEYDTYITIIFIVLLIILFLKILKNYTQLLEE